MKEREQNFLKSSQLVLRVWFWGAGSLYVVRHILLFFGIQISPKIRGFAIKGVAIHINCKQIIYFQSYLSPTLRILGVSKRPMSNWRISLAILRGVENLKQQLSEIRCILKRAAHPEAHVAYPIHEVSQTQEGQLQTQTNKQNLKIRALHTPDTQPCSQRQILRLAAAVAKIAMEMTCSPNSGRTDSNNNNNAA